MPTNTEATKIRARYAWRHGRSLFVSFPDLTRAFKALDKLSRAGHAAEYDGETRGRYWIKFERSL